MQPGALVELATELVHRVLRFEAPADAVVAEFFRQHRAPGSRERRTLVEIVYAVLRRRSLLMHLAQSGRGEIERRLALLAWPANAAYLRAALSAHEVDWLEQVGRVDTASLPERLRHNLPEWLAERLQREVGAEFWPLVAALEQPAALDLRVNVAKASREAVLAALAAQGIAAHATRHAPAGVRLEGRPALHKVDVFVRGEVEVQDEGSQLVALLAGARRGEMVADFCAGGGGKTLALGAAMRSTGRLYAFDVSAHRLAGLKPRLARSGLSNVYPVQIAHERDERIKRLAGKLDRVLVDAPCSGLGTLRRSPDLKWRQTPEAVAVMAVRQAAILAAAARLVKPGGRLVYATCSLLREENEAIAEAFSAARAADFRVLPAQDALRKAQVADPGNLVSGDCMRLWPHRHATDAFFGAVWERT